MMVVVCAVAALCGGLLFNRLHVPAGGLIGAMVAVGGLSLSGVTTVAPTPAVRMLAFAVVGWSLGHDVEPSLLRELGSAAGPILIGLAVLLLAGGLAAWALWALGVADPATAFLAMSPGGLSQMAALSAAMGGNAAVVAAVHLLRIVTVVLVAPLVVRFISSGT